MIDLIGVQKSYLNHTVLQDINLFIPQGEIFGIIGKSGAGKSTLLRSINLLERPDAGTICVDGEDITHWKGRKLSYARHKMAMIFQQFNLLDNKTVYDNIALPMRIQKQNELIIRDKVHELLSFVELSEKSMVYPAQLSGGQKQRVAIARALSCSPKILLCDEATSALDPETTESILELLRKLQKLYGITIVMVTHQMEVVKRICHRLALLDAGRIVETMTIAKILHDKNSIARGMLYAQLSPKLPPCLSSQLISTPNNQPLLKILFEGEGATVPFISQVSRDLGMDINILLANIDRFDGVSCGILVVSLHADQILLNKFIQCCEQSQLMVEVLGYVANAVD